MDEKKNAIRDEKLEQVSGGGSAFEDIPKIEPHDYDEDTKLLSNKRPDENLLQGR